MDYYTVKAIKLDREFAKKVKSGGTFRTGSGRENIIVEVDGKVIWLRTARSKNPIAVSRDKFRKALEYMYRYRTGTRKHMERFSKFSSALLGLLRLALADIAKITRTFRGLLRITLKGCRHVFCTGSRSPDDMEMVKQYGGRAILLSYWDLRQDKYERWKSYVSDAGLKGEILLDSGAYSAYSAQLEGKEFQPLRVEEYLEFIVENREWFSAVLNLDEIGNDHVSKRNATYLKAHGINPIEVWHVQSDWAKLDALVRADHDVIAIGGSVFKSREERLRIFDELFRRYPIGVNFHLLGGASPYLGLYPWFSTDSSSFLAGRKFGRIVTPLRQFKAPSDWTNEQTLAYNIVELASIEDNYHGSYQVKIPVPIQSHVPRKQKRLHEWEQVRLSI